MADIKTKVQKQAGIPHEEQKLLFQGKELDDAQKLSDCGVKHGSTLELGDMVITVKTPDGRSFPVSVKPSESVKDVKKKVLEQEGIPMEHQRLIFGDNELDDEKRLSDCGIKHGSTLELGDMVITVKTPDGRSFLVSVKPDDSVKDVKKKILEQEGIPVEHQRLLFADKELDDKSTLADNNIKHGSQLELGAMQLRIRTPEGEIVPIDVAPDDNIQTVKHKVAKATGIPIKNQFFEVQRWWLGRRWC